LAIPAILFREEPSERRREDRWRVRLVARWLDADPVGQSLTILNLSTSGFLLETDQPLRAGSYLIVEMSGEVTKICRTSWSSGKFHGATFSEPLSDIELQDLTSSSSVVWPLFGGEAHSASIKQPADPTSGNFDSRCIDDNEKFPVAIRLRVIVGASAALWGLVGGGFGLAFFV
jgi:hypothetical protein